MPASGHTPLSHASYRRGVIKESRTARGSRTKCMFLHAHEQCEGRKDAALGSCSSMHVLCMLERRRFIAAMMGPQRKDDPDPDVGKRPHGHRMAFALSSFALVIVCGPRFTLRRLPGKLMKGIAQRFDTTHATMGFGVHTTLKE